VEERKVCGVAPMLAAQMNATEEKKKGVWFCNNANCV